MMKKILLFLAICFAGFIYLAAQDTASCNQITVYSEHGWIMKAKNDNSTPAKLKFRWTTQGTNSSGEIVNSIAEESQQMTLNPNELRQLFTAPQDPNKEITYVFVDIVIIQCDPISMQDLINEKKKAKIESGQ